MERFHVKELANGLALLGQPIEHVSSAALSLLVPAGAAHDPPGAEGAASVIAEWCLRGAAGRDSRQLSAALDELGCQHSQSIFSEHIQFSAAQLGRSLIPVLELLADIIRRPNLQDDTFDPCRDLSLQDLQSLQDEPARMCHLLLREKFYPYPLGRSAYGREPSLRQMSADQARRHVRQCFRPAGGILAVAGRFDWDRFRGRAEELFGDWTSGAAQPVATQAAAGGLTYLPKESAQVHLGLAQRSVTPGHRLYYAARLAESVLSGGMSSRLFVEVREKRGLAYHVSSRYHTVKSHAGLFTYVGTTPPQACQTLQVTLGELKRLARGVREEEMARSRTQLKSTLVLQGESTIARANTLASDWYYLGRLRSLEELSRAIDGTTAQDVAEYARDCPAEGFTVLLIGPEELKIDPAELGP